MVWYDSHSNLVSLFYGFFPRDPEHTRGGGGNDENSPGLSHMPKHAINGSIIHAKQSVQMFAFRKGDDFSPVSRPEPIYRPNGRQKSMLHG